MLTLKPAPMHPQMSRNIMYQDQLLNYAAVAAAAASERFQLPVSPTIHPNISSFISLSPSHSFSRLRFPFPLLSQYQLTWGMDFEI